MNRILLATDGSEHAGRAARMAGELSHHFDAPVDVIHTVPNVSAETPGSVPEYVVLKQVYSTQRELLEKAGKALVDAAADLEEETGGRVEKTEVMVGFPAHAIAAFAEEVGADCIVMGRRGLGELKGLFMGSVSQRVGQLTQATLITTR